MKKIILIILITVAGLNARTQTSNIDSLRKQLNIATSDTAKLNTLVRLGYYYQDSKPDSLLFYGKELLELANRAGDDRMISIAYSSIGQYEYIVGNYSLSLQWLFKSLQLAETINDNNRIANTHNLLGNTYKEYGAYKNAIAHYLICKRVAELHDDKLNNMFALGNLGEMYAMLGNTDSALLYSQQAYALGLKNKSRFIGISLICLAKVHLLLNNKNLSLEYFRQGIELYKENFGNSRYLSKGYLAMAGLYDQYHEVDSAVYFAHVSLNVAQQVPYLKGIGNAGKFLSTVYDSLHITDSAFLYQKLFVAIDDSLNDRAKVASFENMTFLETIRQQEKQRDELKLKEARKQNIEYILIVLGIVVFVIFFLLLSRSMITNVKLIGFLSVVVLLIVFEFLNLLLHPFLERVTHHSPVLMLLALVCIAALLVPLHHRLEKWATYKLVEKNKRIRLVAAKKTIEKLENDKTIQQV